MASSPNGIVIYGFIMVVDRKEVSDNERTLCAVLVMDENGGET